MSAHEQQAAEHGDRQDDVRGDHPLELRQIAFDAMQARVVGSHFFGRFAGLFFRGRVFQQGPVQLAQHDGHAAIVLSERDPGEEG